MNKSYVDFANVLGSVKPMHAVNNGPSCNVGKDHGAWGESSRNGNLAEYIAAGIPFARTHDASFHAKYGLEHTVDVHAIFPDFDKDPDDPASYDFVCTDHYMDMIEAGGAKVFYRLGSRIEHEVKKYGTLPPKDYKKWAVICEHIIRHYTEGWAGGTKRDIEYWEIWNEPDLDADDSTNKRNWGGTKKEFFEFYHVAATHLKNAFPHLKIGGPASSLNKEWIEDFIAQLRAPLDFFSWHTYAYKPETFVENAKWVRGVLDSHGYVNTESILNEWNYVRNWVGRDYRYSRVMAKTAKGAAFNLSSMIECQKAGVDMLMYYDARPGGWNDIFDFDSIDSFVTTAYYSFPMFNELYKLGTEVESGAGSSNVYLMGAKNGDNAAIIMTHYNDDDAAGAKRVPIEIRGLGANSRTVVEMYKLDDASGYAFLEQITVFGDKLIIEREIPNYTSYLLKLKIEND